AVLSGMRGSEPVILQDLLQRASTDVTASVVTVLAATIVRRAQDAPVRQIFEWIADDNRPACQRSALLQGEEVVLLATSLPGPSVRNGFPSSASSTSSTLPCPTCPGGRGGPGGAYAYSSASDFLVASGRGPAAANARTLRISAEPGRLGALAARAARLGGGGDE